MSLADLLHRLCVVLFVVVAVLPITGTAGTDAAEKSAKVEKSAKAEKPKKVKATGMADKIEQMAYAMVPEEKLNRAMGLFAPVTKKYLPVYGRFQREYDQAQQKIPVIVKYAPYLDKALAEAKAMSVPPKYEKEKADYIKTAEMFVSAVRVSVRLYQMSQN